MKGELKWSLTPVFLFSLPRYIFYSLLFLKKKKKNPIMENKQ